jgi:hypothetical protein
VAPGPPRGTVTTYHFEYGTEGPCVSSPCTATADRSAGSGALIELVSEPISDLQPATTYHYRLVADNGVGPAVAGKDMTLTTLSPEAPLSHGHFPGPPGNDRAWEMVSLPDSGGNPTNGGTFSEDGNRAVYGVEGGTPIGDSGSPAGQYFSQRTPSGWQTQLITPSRDQLIGPDWKETVGAGDLSSLVSRNSKFGDLREAAWRFGPGMQPAKLFEITPPQVFGSSLITSESTSVVGAVMQGGALDPAYPVAATQKNLYEIGSGAPQLLSLLPSDAVAACGVNAVGGTYGFVATAQAHSVSSDGRFAFFPSQGDGPCDSDTPVQLYLRDLASGETKAISAPPLSGPNCSAAFVKSTSDAAFFWTQSRLALEDTATAGCTEGSAPLDGDVYRYDLGAGSLECVTCVVADFDVDIPINVGGNGNRPADEIAVSDDGSRVYFSSAHSLLPGTPSTAAYRVEVATGDLAYLGPINVSGGQLKANSDGSVLLFNSQSPALNPLGDGTDNGGTSQLYRYDDRDRSLVCISCPYDGSAPRGPASGSSLDEDGNILAFLTPTALLPADQNTARAGQFTEAGQDIYEWRDGRLLLVTDGLSNWTESGTPILGAVSPSGRDIFFSAYAQYTPDALDAYRRVYDARLGGGFEYPKPPPPCPLEVCQGTPKGAPEEPPPGTGAFVGPGNVARTPARCAKGKARRKGRCVAKKPKRKQKAAHHRAAKHDGRAHR